MLEAKEGTKEEGHREHTVAGDGRGRRWCTLSRKRTARKPDSWGKHILGRGKRKAHFSGVSMRGVVARAAGNPVWSCRERMGRVAGDEIREEAGCSTMQGFFCDVEDFGFYSVCDELSCRILS